MDFVFSFSNICTCFADLVFFLRKNTPFGSQFLLVPIRSPLWSKCGPHFAREKMVPSACGHSAVGLWQYEVTILLGSQCNSMEWRRGADCCNRAMLCNVKHKRLVLLSPSLSRLGVPAPTSCRKIKIKNFSPKSKPERRLKDVVALQHFCHVLTNVF